MAHNVMDKSLTAYVNRMNLMSEWDPIEGNEIPPKILKQILSHLPLKNLVRCREVCPYWRDVIDLYCPIKDIIFLEQDDKFLKRKLELMMTSCILCFFRGNAPNIFLTHPHTIKSFLFSDRHLRYSDDYNEDELDVEHARGLLSQIKPFVEFLLFDTLHFQVNILSVPYLYPKLRSLKIGSFEESHTINDNLQLLFSHRFPSLETFHLQINYLNEILTDEVYANFFNFLANHRHTVKQLMTKIYYGDSGQFYLPEITQEFDVSRKVKGILWKGQLQLESLELILPPKYVPAWAPIIANQKKLIDSTVGYKLAVVGPGGVPFYAIAPGISSSVSTLRKVILTEISSVAYDGVTWIPLDVSLFRDAVNLTELCLSRNHLAQINHGRTPKPNDNDGAQMINLDEINLTNLKCLIINEFVCNFEELQRLVENAPILETLYLFRLLPPGTKPTRENTGLMEEIAHTFWKKDTKREIGTSSFLNDEFVVQNCNLDRLRTCFYFFYKEVNDGKEFILTSPYADKAVICIHSDHQICTQHWDCSRNSVARSTPYPP